MKRYIYNSLYILIGLTVIGLAAYKLYFGKQSSLGMRSDNFEEMIKEPGTVIIDVRSAFEFQGDKISGAQNISFTASDFRERVQLLDKEKTYLVYDQNGKNALLAARTMKELGFNKVHSLKGGIDEWKRENKPVVK